MTDLSNYYQRDPRNRESIPSERFPSNHVTFSELTKPISDSPAVMITDDVLKEFDSVAPLDKYIGTEKELKQLRKLVSLFCEGFDNNPFVSVIGRYIIKAMVLDNLRNRKKVLQYYHSNKEFIETNGKFNAPIIITGLARSGTTLLHRIMSEDPNTRSPYRYELEMPIPPLTAGVNPLKDPRIESMEAASKLTSRIMPGFLEKFAESHHASSTDKEESFSYMLLHNGFSMLVGLMAGKAYLDAFSNIKVKRPIFRYERIFFTMLDAYRPAKSHCTLKAPVYAEHFPLILEEYPDARIVMTHRNPLNTLPSACRLVESMCIAFDQNGSFDKYRFGQFMQKGFENILTTPLNYRNEHPEKEGQIFDCIYEELFSDPIDMVKRIYRKFDLEYTKEFEDRMKGYLRNNKQGKYGRHKYSLEEYGFNGEDLYHKYHKYMDYYGFGIPEKFERPSSFDFGLENEGT